MDVILKDTVLNSTDMDVLALWLVNCWRLLNLLRQYGGEENEEWMARNTATQNGHRIQNFQLEPIRHRLQLRVDSLYQSFMKKTVEPMLTPKIGRRR